MSGIAESKSEAALSYVVRTLALPEVDKQGMQLDAMYIPKPRFSSSPFTFSLTLRHRIMWVNAELLFTTRPNSYLAIFN